MSIKKNDAASRSLTAILAGTDDEEVQSNLNEMVADSEKPAEEQDSDDVTEEEVEEVEEDDDEPISEEEVEEDEEESEDEDEEESDDADDDDEVEEISEEEVESARKAADEVEEISEEEVESARREAEEPISEEEIDDDDEDDDEPVEEENVEDIMDEESDDESEEEFDDDDEVEEISEEEVESARREAEEADGCGDEEAEACGDELVDDEAATEAVACLVKNGFTCSVDAEGKIAVTACGEVDGCECGEPGCQECDEKKEASVTLRPVSDDEKVEASDICSVLSGAESDKPFYTVLIKGMPVAAICLEDQPNAEAIRAYFLSNEYPKKLASAMATGGAKNVLDTLKARMFTAKACESELAQSMKAEAKAEFDEQIAKAVIAAKDKFINAVKLAVAGMNKNFFTEDNNLKAACYEAFAAQGMDASQAESRTNEVFAQADSYFETVIAKAQELMGKSDEAFEEITAMVANAGIAQRETKTFASALEQGNNPIVAAAMRDEQPKVATASVMKTKKLFGRR